ncbi:DNA polymerase-4 [Lysinibacillus composti]|uniref:DNA polymerase IV n=1 Tax=Lysinibacillus composti TaxID=720633 RepID=A0A3N9UJM1_9BACI|nr:DNA polymerase IV [Lysinibacillus composti]MBM7607249.1 DNA polymerase-4 [Lysinibacillus composti]RQW76174.1 DNA polymerase IV [Lysinibacillus composti]
MSKKTILLVDMNSFFASVHQAENPSLLNKPIIVGGIPNNKNKGMVIAASYEAKNKGVYTTMSVYEALKKCPNAIIVERNHNLYSSYSKIIMDFLRLIGPIEKASIDEAYVDITERVAIGTEPRIIAEYIQKILWEKLTLGCSIGCSNTKTSAKMAADIKKPFGYVHLEQLQFCSFFHPQKLNKLHGCGQKTEEKLNKHNIYTIGDLAKADPLHLKLILGVRGEWLQKVSLGRGSDKLNTDREKGDKTIGKEKTFAQPISDSEVLMNLASKMIESLCSRLNNKKLKAYTIAIVYKMEWEEGRHSKSITLEQGTSDPNMVNKLIEKLYEDNLSDIPIVLFGVRLSNFRENKYVQLSLF